MRSQSWHMQRQSQRTNICVLLVRQTFLVWSRVHGAEEGQFACVCGVGVLNSQSCHANIRPVTSYFGRKQPALGPALRRTVHSRLRLQSWYTQRQSQRTNICVLVFRQTFPDRSRVHGAEESSPVLRGDAISTVRLLCDIKSLNKKLHLLPRIVERPRNLEV